MDISGHGISEATKTKKKKKQRNKQRNPFSLTLY